MNTKKIITALSLISFLLLTSCAKPPEPKIAPCNTYGQNCEPKVKINQWQPAPSTQPSR